MLKATRRNKALKATRFLALGAALLSTTSPALAQYNLSYLSYGLGSQLLWPMRNMMYLPYNYGYGSAYGLFYPAGAALNRLRGTGAYTGGSTPYVTPQPAQPTVEQGYTDAEPLTDPRQRVRQVRVGQMGTDQVSYARWANVPNAQQQGQAQPLQKLPPGQQMMPQAQGSAAAMQQGQGQGPPLAPQRGQLSVPHQEAQPAQGSMPIVHGPAPLAANFVNEVNGKFNGDISMALFDPQTRSYAKALGLVNGESIFTADLSKERVQLIQQVLRDSTLDPVSKLDTVKILLHNAPAASAP